ncbi:MAG: hypothetical protein KC503_06485 [Myxococcales bacterium]|nr:hypothetical protein [Myxococcales bacterium]
MKRIQKVSVAVALLLASACGSEPGNGNGNGNGTGNGSGQPNVKKLSLSIDTASYTYCRGGDGGEFKQIGVQLIVDSPSDTTAQIEDIIVKRGSDVVAQTAMVNCESGLNSSLASIVDGRRTWRIDAGQPVSFGFVCGVPAFEPSHPSSGTFAAELIFGVLVGGESHQLTQAIDVRFDAPVPNGSGQAFCGL